MVIWLFQTAGSILIGRRVIEIMPLTGDARLPLIQ
jgi:hypothetical protein